MSPYSVLEYGSEEHRKAKKMSVSCKCMNIVVKLDQPSAGSDLSGRRFDLEAVLKKQQQDRVAAAAAATTKTTTTTTTPSDDHFLFFKEVSAPPRSSFFIY